MSRGGVHLGGLAEHVRARGGPVFPAVLGTPLSLTLSGNEITDAVRAAGLSGDGLSPEGSTGIWEATTNLVTNGGLETNTTGWAGLIGTETIARVTSQAKFGAASLETITPGGVSYEGCRAGDYTVSPSTTYTASVWVKGSGGTLAFAAEERNSGVYVTQTAGGPFTPGSSWERKSVTFTTNSSTNRIRFKVYASGSIQALTFYVDGAQLEAQPLATPYVETNGGTASRSAARVRIPATYLDETQAWVAARVRMGWVNTADPSGNPALFDWRDDANNLIQVRFDTTNNQWELQRRNGGGTGEATTADTFALSDVVTVIAAWDASNLKVSVDGSAFTSAAAANIPTLAASTADVGSVAGSSEHIDADLFWFACGTGTLADADAATIHAIGNTDPLKVQFPVAAAVKLIWPAITSSATSYA